MKEEDRDRDRSPLRSEERCDAVSCNQPDSKKQKLAFGFGKRTGSEQKKGIQIKLGSVSVSETIAQIKYCICFHAYAGYPSQVKTVI